MNKRQDNIQNLQHDKQEALRQVKIYKVFAVLANCSAATSAAFLFVELVEQNTDKAVAATLWLLICLYVGGLIQKDVKRYKQISSKFQKQINRIQRQK